MRLSTSGTPKVGHDTKNNCLSLLKPNIEFNAINTGFMAALWRDTIFRASPAALGDQITFIVTSSVQYN